MPLGWQTLGIYNMIGSLTYCYIKALHFYLSLLLFHSINLVTKLILSLILNKINNFHGIHLVLAALYYCFDLVHLRVKTYQLLSINLGSIWHNSHSSN